MSDPGPIKTGHTNLMTQRQWAFLLGGIGGFILSVVVVLSARGVL